MGLADATKIFRKARGVTRKEGMMDKIFGAEKEPVEIQIPEQIKWEPLTDKSPQWQEDQSKCQKCTVESIDGINIFDENVRPHHCRFCGLCVCNRCSKWKVSQQRACRDCFTKIQKFVNGGNPKLYKNKGSLPDSWLQHEWDTFTGLKHIAVSCA